MGWASLQTLKADPGLIDALYEATLEPQNWVGVLERLADSLGGTSAWLSRLDVTDGTGSGLTARLDPSMSEVYHEYYHSLNPFSTFAEPQGFLQSWRPMVLTDERRVERDRLVRSEYFNDFMRPQEVDGVLIIRLALIGRTTAAININRSEKKGGFSTSEKQLATSLLPHLVRAYTISSKLSEAQAARAELGEALQILPHAVFILGADGLVRQTNGAAEALMAARDELRVLAGRLTASDPEVERQLDARILVAASRDAEVRRGGSLTIACKGSAPLTVSISPLRTERADVFSGGPSVLVCVDDPAAKRSVSDLKLTQLFGLTPAEARVARAIQEGARPKEIAEALRLSPNTVRVHLARVFDKTGASRQADLARMLSLIAPD